jgi:transposase
MTRFVVGDDRSQSTLFPERLEDYLAADNPVRAIDVFVDELDLARLGFGGVEPEATGRPAYHPATLLKIYVYGYLNRVQSSRRLERECQRNIELVWLTGRLMPDFKTIADFRKDNGEAIRKVCREFVVLCRRLELFSEASVAIDGKHLPGDEAWLIGEHRMSGEKKYYLANLPARTDLRSLAATIKARWICEQAHQQLKEELGLDHYEGRSWQGLHRHALMTMIAYAFLQHRRLAQGGGKKRISGPPPQPSLPAVRHAIVALILRPPNLRCPHCRRQISEK